MNNINCNEKSCKTQRENILRHLKSGLSINPLEAQKQYGCMRLAARICELKQEHAIQKRMVKVGNFKKVAEYWLEREV